MKSRYLLLVLAIFSFFMSCEQYSQQQLIGHWVGVNALQKGTPLQLNPNEIQFLFKKNGTYTYQSTIGYHEAGLFNLEGDLLFSKDTLQANAKQKAVKILKLNQDSLQLEMLANGKEQTILLIKK